VTDLDIMTQLRQRLRTLTPGPVDDDFDTLLAGAWDQFEGAGEQGTTGAKLRGRMENVRWDPPVLTFEIERHGATVMGSTRGAVHRWTVNIESGLAECDERHSYRQLVDRASPLRVKPLVDEIAEVIGKGKGDERLKWSPDRRSVRVLVADFIDGWFKQTREGRRRRFRDALEGRLTQDGWQRVARKRDVYEKI